MEATGATDGAHPSVDPFEFVARAAHDLRNQIAVVVTAASLLQRSWSSLSDDLRLEQVGVIARHASSLRDLTDAVLDWASIETGRLPAVPKPVDLADVVRAVLGDENAARVRVDVPHVRVTADEGHLRRVLANLVGNATKYGTPPIRVSAVALGDEVVLRVHDAGPGVPETFRERLFEPFARHAPAGEPGTGLGLAIVKGLVELNGGRVWYEHGDTGPAFAVALHRADG